MKVVGRLAPSPTGALHLGNARSFLMAWLSVRSQQGRMILRIEDLDSPRVKPWAQAATLTDLTWLGLDWDEGPDVGGPEAPYVQTQRLDNYARVLSKLREAELVYPCDCSRSDVAQSASAPHEALEGPIYAGTCRHRSAKDAALFPTGEFAWRFRASDQVHQWHDRFKGPQRANVAAQLGDFVVAKGDGTPAYQLAVIVDDHVMGVTEVIRGDDLIPSTFRQLDLLSALTWPVPDYCHLPLMVGTDGRRLAKRHGDSRLSWFRGVGYSAEQIVGYLAWTAGMIAEPKAIGPRELLSCWPPQSWEAGPTVVGLAQLLRTLDAM